MVWVFHRRQQVDLPPVVLHEIVGVVLRQVDLLALQLCGVAAFAFGEFVAWTLLAVVAVALVVLGSAAVSLVGGFVGGPILLVLRLGEIALLLQAPLLRQFAMDRPIQLLILVRFLQLPSHALVLSLVLLRTWFVVELVLLVILLGFIVSVIGCVAVQGGDFVFAVICNFRVGAGGWRHDLGLVEVLHFLFKHVPAGPVAAFLRGVAGGVCADAKLLVQFLLDAVVVDLADVLLLLAVAFDLALLLEGGEVFRGPVDGDLAAEVVEGCVGEHLRKSTYILRRYTNEPFLFRFYI